ncbi:anthranilate synthase component 1 [Corynebacterium poyangense]|uniref:Anthranilate synthase component 1 n=1 Tax=Corynebacterium poyangense TaxID=2684405 RepID=A0A7H0SRY4_9CORY|nr:anthranilate synthase component 1 [Corynebacterium poyangense]QNQ91309.1 anthranilate synthase component 1 [Corynebacterium poyangense]
MTHLHQEKPPALEVIRRSIPYQEEASALFERLGGVSATDSVLLESADITTHSGITSVMVLSASLRLSCFGQKVYVQALSPSGAALLAQLTSQLQDYQCATTLPDTSAFHFPISHAADERERLKAISTMAPLRQLQFHSGIQDSSGTMPFLAGGWAFDYLATFESLPEVAESSNTYPDYQYIMAEVLLEINHQEHTAQLTAVATADDLDRIQEQLDAIEEICSTAPAPRECFTGNMNPSPLHVHASIADEPFRSIVEDLQQEIERGEVYQILPARNFHTDCPDAFAAYKELRRTNPSPYMFYIRGSSSLEQHHPYELFGASPESNLKFTAANREVQLYPVAGTRPRGLNPDGTVNHELDIRAELYMRTDAKELAEHIMLVDLARNDLARVALPATRKVADLLHVDRYSRVMHLVSRVVATLDPEFDALDAYRACMNMGTLTGAPKLRAAELIRSVEGQRRGSYGGAVGYLRGNGDMDNCIVIRSAYVQDGKANVQAGCGVVRDSRPQAEADETLHKAYAVLHAIALATGRPLEVIR